MKKLITFIVTIVLSASIIYGQSVFIGDELTDPETIRNSWEGYRLPTTGEHRILIIYVNMIYDIDTINDPISNNNIWPQAQLEGINVEPTSWPIYINEYINVEYPGPTPLKTFTRLFAESSFNNLIVLGDYLVVNIKHSTISGGDTFIRDTLISSVISLINLNGGLQTLHGHDSLLHYRSLPNVEKFFHVMMILRNTTTKYGGVGKGNGQAWGPVTAPIINLLTADDDYFDTYTISYQCVGADDLSLNPTLICTHEFSHFLIGHNNFHTSGGHSWGEIMCYIGIQYGYGLMGGASSGLVNCNGYERYRLGWMHADNSHAWPVTANGEYSDISIVDGNQSFILDDFITTGDVIRIKLPYIESPASNQYIWLENHKILDSTLNFLQYENTHECRPNAQKGIYSYYQTGRDVLVGHDSLVYSEHDTDNLRMICANGFYDQAYEGLISGDCVITGLFSHFRDSVPNPLFGNNDLSSYYIDIPGDDTLKPGIHASMAQAKTYNNTTEMVDNLPYLMSEINPFHGHSVMSLNTNPAPFNTTTYYHLPFRDSLHNVFTNPNESFRNQPDVILTGLKIEMTPLANDDYQVDISWDNYDLDTTVRWTGSIVLKEELYLKAGSVLLLDQNLTPNTIYRNETTGLFSAPTLFRCDNGSQMFQEAGSELVVDNMSTLLIDDGSEFFANAGRLEVKNDAYLQIASGGYFEQNEDAEIYADNKGNVLIEQGGHYLIDGSDLTIKAGGRFEIESCATLEIINGGRLVIESGAEICIHPGAFFILEPGENLVFNEPFSMGNCLQFSHENFETEVMATPPTNVINGTVNWDNKIYNFTDNLYIEAEAVLNLSGGSILRFAPGNKVIVRRQGTMNISNSIMTNLCENQFWNGIEVWGNDTMSQLTYPDGKVYQGKLVVNDSSLIENALIGILAGSMSISYPEEDPESESPGTPIPISTEFNGGIVQVRSSELRNNRTGIYLAPYENFLPTGSEQIKNNASYFKNCDFRLTHALIPNLEPVAFLRLNGVRGIQSYGNHFINGSELQGEEAGVGVLSLNSNFEVKEHCYDEFTPCQDYRLSRFENLHYGIKALGAATAKTFTVDTAEFIRNSRGIFTSGINDFTITRNTFNLTSPFGGIENLESLPENIIYTGLYIEGESNGFSIEENRFVGFYTNSDEGAKSVGAIFNDTGPYSNALYNNRFDSLQVATLAMNRNREKHSENGLCIKCNQYSKNGFDIVVTYDSQLYSWGGIAPNQGSDGGQPDAPAGNRFSWNDIDGSERDINNLGQHITYYYHDIPDPEAVPLMPKYYDRDKVTIVPGDPEAIWDPELSCPSNLTPPGGGHDEEELRGMLAEAEQQVDSTQTMINMLRDAGDTQALHWDVSMSVPSHSVEVYSELMSVSPYVSDTVLAASIEKEYVLVDAMIRDVLVANPHSVKSEALMEKLDQRLQPLPGYMLDEILQGQSLVSVFENLQAGLAHSLQQQAQYQKQLVQLYLNDTIQPAAAADSLVSLLLASAHSAHWYRAAFLWQEQGNASSSANILNSIPSSFSLNAEQLQAHSQLVSWLAKESLLRNEDKRLSVPDSTAVALLFDVMEFGDLPVSIFARNILLAHNLIEHQPQYLLPEDTKSAKVKHSSSQSPTKDEALKLFPNPAREYVIVDFDLGNMKATDGTGMLSVIALDGKLIESMPLTKTKDQIVFPLQGYKPGTYVFTLYFGNKMLESKRLIIQ
jgi:hypothetical protein